METLEISDKERIT